MNRKSLIQLVIALILVDLAVISWLLNRSGAPYQGQLIVGVFGFALLALIPLAALIGEATVQLSNFFGPLVTGLLNASLSNVPELSIGVFLLVQARANANSLSAVQLDLNVLRGLLLGSVINNILLTLGLAVFFGAIKHGKMRFDAGNAAGYASMLALAVVGLALPALADGFAKHPSLQGDETVSLIVGVILIVTYIMYIATSVYGFGSRPKHPTMAEEGEGAPTGAQAGSAQQGGARLAVEKTSVERLVSAEERDEAHSEERERAKHAEMRRMYPHRFVGAIVLLVFVTGLTVLMAGILVSVTDAVIVNTPLTPLSTGLILFPIVCNLGEAAGALASVRKKDVEGMMAIAAGSSVQMPLFVAPLLVFIGFIIAAGNPNLWLTLVFRPLELIVAGLVTFVYALVNLDGETTWLEGLQLLAFYAMVAVTAFVLPGT